MSKIDFTSTTEEWRWVVGYEGLYEVSSIGRVRSAERVGIYRGRWNDATQMTFAARVMSICEVPSGYKYVKLKRPNATPKHSLVHRLVAAAFIGPANGLQVNHKDGVKANNSLTNIEYCTSQENLRHCIDVLGKKRGEGAGRASKLKEVDIPVIRADGRILREIAADYGVTPQAIFLVKKSKNWAHVK